MSRYRSTADGFDYTHHIGLVCADMARRLDALRHVDPDRIAFSFCQTRKRVLHGLQASLTPLRFEGGYLSGEVRGRRWSVQRLFAPDGREMLYILSVYMPRFQDQPLRHKLTTLLHELWHVGPNFDGDLRRHEGRCYMHSPSQKHYDAAMEQLADQYLAADPPAQLFEFLRCNFKQLQERFGPVHGTRIPRPKLIPLDEDQHALG